MGLFSRKRSKSSMSSLTYTGKRLLLVSGCMMTLFMMAPVANNSVIDNMIGIEIVYASEGQSWKQESDGRWRVFDSNTGQYLTNQWYQDISGGGHWYLLKSDGYMAEGLYKDVDGSYYYLNTVHDGTYGRLMTTGTYNNIYIETNQNHDGTWGRIINTEVIGQLENSLNGTIDNSNPGGGSGGGATENNIPGRETDGGYDLGGGTGGYTVPEKEVYVPGS